MKRPWIIIVGVVCVGLVVANIQSLTTTATTTHEQYLNFCEKIVALQQRMNTSDAVHVEMLQQLTSLRRALYQQTTTASSNSGVGFIVLVNGIIACLFYIISLTKSGFWIARFVRAADALMGLVYYEITRDNLSPAVATKHEQSSGNGGDASEDE